MPCLDGTTCNEGSTGPDGCKAGLYCNNRQTKNCTKGHYCPFGSKTPRKCHALALCPEGSKSQDIDIVATLFLLVCAGAAYLGGHCYGTLVSRGVWAFLVCGVLVAAMWMEDKVIAGFLSLFFTVVVANWALLQMAACPAFVARLLLFVSVAAALMLIGLVNPPWSMLAGGLSIFVFLVWLMSRHHFCVMMTGRGLLVVAFAVLLAGYWQNDPAFTTWIFVVLVLTGSGLLASWAYGHCRQRRQVELPFLTRWTPRSLASLAAPMEPQDSSATFGMEQGGAPAQQHASPLSPRRLEGSNPILTWGLSQQGTDHSRHVGPVAEKDASALADQVIPGRGVSFFLQDAGFYLPDGRQLLKNVSVAIGPGRRVAVMGPSGSGKTTLLAVLSGRASYGRVSGRLQVGGGSADDLRFLKYTTGFVPQDDVLLGELTVQENIHFQAVLRLPQGITAERVGEQVQRVAEDLKISHILKERVGTPDCRGVSGGQRKRVSIGMELVTEPLLLFADEPTSGLDSTTAHDVVWCLNDAAAKLGTTVISVIHQPRYETLCLFDDLILLGTGGGLMYSGPAEGTVEHFQKNLQIVFPANTNPADIFLDAIQVSHHIDDFAQIWCDRRPKVSQYPKTSKEFFHRQPPPFFRAVLIYMDRSLLQSLRAHNFMIMHQGLCIGTIMVVCTVLTYERLDQFIMQSAFASLFLMLLQSVASQRIFGADILVTMREARVGMPMVAYLLAKDLAALFEITLSSAVFTAVYGSQSGSQIDLPTLFAGSWAFVYCVFGLGYIFSIVLPNASSQMCLVVISFLCFCVAGVYQPQLPEMAAYFGGRGWMIPAMSPVRWLFGFLLTAEVSHLTDISRRGAAGSLSHKGYDLKYLDQCTSSTLGMDISTYTLKQAWLEKRGWVCSPAPMLLLGVIFRFMAGLCLMLAVYAQTSGWARFFGQSSVGSWKLAGKLFSLLIGFFLAVFLIAEIWSFGLLRMNWGWINPVK